jgi:cytochrome c oxidase assembly factor CtaG
MNIATLCARIAGLLLLGWTVFSIFKHVQEKRMAAKTIKASEPAEEVIEQSIVEQILNNILLYLWLAFMLAFSTGMIVNN